MAIRKCNRARPRRARSAGPNFALSSRRHARAAGAGASARLPLHSIEASRHLSVVVRRLQTIYGIAVTAAAALRHQAADQDVEIAECLRAGVCDPVADQARHLEAIVEHCRAKAPRSKS
jgi:hypothetical protein